MNKKSRILILIGIIVVAMLSGCGKVKDSNTIEVKLDEDGYPLYNVIYLDNTEYEIPGEIFQEEKISHELEHELLKSKKVTVILPVVMPIWTWEFDSTQDGVEILKDEIIYPEADLPYDIDGPTNSLQRITIEISEDIEIPILHFKWVNINEEDKEFEDMLEHYLLSIKLK